MHVRNILVGAGCLGLLLTAGAASAGVLNSADQAFIKMAARTDMTEAHEGQVFESQANRSDVKALAKALDQDHTTAYQQLTELAEKTGGSIPKGINITSNKAFERLQHLKGDRFDRQFARDEIAAHRRAIEAYKQEAKRGQNPDVKAYAARMIPILEKHLSLAEKCLKPA